MHLKEKWQKFNSFLEVSSFGNARFLKTKQPFQTVFKFDRNGICDGYRYLKFSNTKRYLPMHKIVAKLFIPNSRPQNYRLVDHINRVRADNRAVNLRWCSSLINNQNKNPQGIRFKKFMNGWRSSVTLNGETKILGYFKTYNLAYRAAWKQKLQNIKELYEQD